MTDNNDYRDLMNRVKRLEEDLQRQSKDTEEAEKVIKEIMDVITEMKVNRETNKGKLDLFEQQLSTLRDNLQGISDNREDDDGRKRDMFDRTVMVIIGGIVTHLFSLLKN